MKLVIVFLLISFLNFCFVEKANGQGRDKVIEIPSKYVLPLLVSDPNCPIKLLEPTKTVRYDNGALSFFFTIKNESDTSVDKFIIEELSWFGTQGFTSNHTSKIKNLFAPHSSFSLLNDQNNLDFLAFDDSQAKELKLSDSPRDIWIIMVKSVVSEDKIVYDATSKFEAIEELIGTLEINSQMPREDVKAQEEKLRTEIKRIMEQNN